MTKEEIQAFHDNLNTLMASLECIRLASIIYQTMGTHEAVYPAAEKVLGCAIESSSNMREQIRREKEKLPYKLP